MASIMRRVIQPFLGINVAVDASLIPDNAAQSITNIVPTKGNLAIRSGWVEAKAAIASFSASFGLWLLKATTGDVTDDEYFTVLDNGSTRKPYYVPGDLSSGFTELTDGGSPVDLSSTSDWRAISFDGIGYCFPSGGAVYKHTVGTSTSFELVDAAAPADLTGGVAITWNRTEDLEEETPGTDFAWAAASTVTANGGAGVDKFNKDSISGSDLLMGILNNGTGDPDTTLDFGADKDASGATFLEFDLVYDPTSFDLDPVAAGVTFNITIENNGAAATITRAAEITVLNVSATEQKVTLRFNFESGDTMADWATLRTIRFVSQSGATTEIRAGATGTVKVTAVRQTAVATGSDPTASGTEKRMRFGLAPYDNERDQEATEVLPSSWFQMDASPTRYFDDTSTTYLGNVPTVYTGGFVTPADQMRLYVMFEEENLWRLVITTDETTYDVEYTRAELQNLPLRVTPEISPIGSPVCACAFGEWMVWGYGTGKTNIKHSRVAAPAKLYRTTDSDNDDGRGANFTLSETLTDHPVWMGQAGNNLVILGNEGAYVQVRSGLFPKTMSETRKLAQSMGVYGPHSAVVFRDQIGQPGVAYVTRDLRLAFIQSSQVSVDGEFGFRNDELGLAIRDQIVDYLGGGSKPDSSKLQLFVDEQDDALYIVCETKMLVLLEVSLLTGRRDYTRFSYAFDSTEHWDFVCAFPGHGIRAMRSSGELDTIHYNPDTFARLSTDNGTAIPNGVWRSKAFYTEFRRRSASVAVDRGDIGQAITVRAICDGTTKTATIAANDRFSRFFVDARGREIAYEIEFAPAASPITRVALEEYPIGENKHL